MEFTVTPPIGTPVQWFASADVKVQPLPARVIESTPNGICRLAIDYPGGGTPEIRSAVYHISSPVLFDRGAPTINAQNHGAWQYHPWLTPPESVIKEQAAKAKKAAEDAAKPVVVTDYEKEERVVALSKTHTFDQVCNKVRNLGLKKSDVEAIYVSREIRRPEMSS